MIARVETVAKTVAQADGERAVLDGVLDYLGATDTKLLMCFGLRYGMGTSSPPTLRCSITAPNVAANTAFSCSITITTGSSPTALE